MAKLPARLKRFMWPNSDAPLLLRLAPYIALVVIALALLAGGLAGWNYTNSVPFCGTTCHTMPPEYTTYLQSPHARVQCVECHLGRDSFITQLVRKTGHARLIYAQVFHKYEYPIIATDMRPANEACETCHFPQQFTSDTLKEIKYHLDDANNTPRSIFLVLKIGGGTKRQGLGQGIHWHIENKVSYLSTDPLRQTIPYIRVEDENGKVTEYYDLSSGLTPDQVKGQTLHTMDCIDCHNRVSHSILTPAQAVDNAMNINLVSSKLPNVRQQAVALLNAKYPDTQTALKTIEGLSDFYQTNYPDVYSTQQQDIAQAVSELKSIYTLSNYPEQKLDFTSHPNNVGHQDAPGCFRCHDGKHYAADGTAIRLECNLCHDIPVNADPNQFVTNIGIVRGPEPVSHRSTSWISLHNKAIDTTCAGCHPPKDPKVDYTKLNGSKPPMDGSFCGNVSCHGTEWKYMGLDSAAVKPILDTQLAALKAAEPKPTPTPTPKPPDEVIMPTPTPQGQAAQSTPTPASPATGTGKTYAGDMKAVFDNLCIACHNGPTGMANLDLSTYQTILQGNADGAGIVPGNPDGSLIYKIQSAGGHFGQMTPDELALLKDWILGGALEK
jgi:nitrate/TMAO reductase-like tetraheme cytochrome c subunit